MTAWEGMAMDNWIGHLVVGSLGLLAAGVLALALLWIWRRQPLTSYRFLVAVLVATLLMPLGQWLAQRSTLLRAAPWTERLSAVLPSWGGPGPASATLETHAHVDAEALTGELAMVDVLLALDLGEGAAPERVQELLHGPPTVATLSPTAGKRRARSRGESSPDSSRSTASGSWSPSEPPCAGWSKRVAFSIAPAR